MGVPLDVYRCRIGTFQNYSKSANGNNTTSTQSTRVSSSITIFLLILTSSSFLFSVAVYSSDVISYRGNSETHHSVFNASSLPSISLPPSCCSSTWRPPWPPPWSAPLPVLAVLLATMQSLQNPHHPILPETNNQQLLAQPSYCTAVLIPSNLTQSGLAWSHRCHWLTTPTTSSSWLTRIQRNSYVKSVNGNSAARGKGIKIVAWNKESSLLHNKHAEVESLIAGHHPHILGLSEANLRSNADLTLVQHDDYQLHTAPTMTNTELGISRVVVYTHSSLIVKRRPDLEENTLSAIWLEVGMPRQKKILVANVYREWKYMNQGEHNDT